MAAGNRVLASVGDVGPRGSVRTLCPVAAVDFALTNPTAVLPNAAIAAALANRPANQVTLDPPVVGGQDGAVNVVTRPLMVVPFSMINGILQYFEDSNAPTWPSLWMDLVEPLLAANVPAVLDLAQDIINFAKLSMTDRPPHHAAAPGDPNRAPVTDGEYHYHAAPAAHTTYEEKIHQYFLTGNLEATGTHALMLANSQALTHLVNNPPAPAPATSSETTLKSSSQVPLLNLGKQLTRTDNADAVIATSPVFGILAKATSTAQAANLLKSLAQSVALEIFGNPFTLHVSLVSELLAGTTDTGAMSALHFGSPFRLTHKFSNYEAEQKASL